MAEEKKERRFRWSRELIAWYERAVEYTGYNQVIWGLIASQFHPGDIVCEVACGTGSLARTIAPHVKHLTANDMDENALAYLEREIEKKRIENITIEKGDWKHVCAGKKFDILLFQQFSAFLNDWDLLEQTADRTILAILPSAEDFFRGPANTENKAELPVTAKKGSREHWESAADFLEKKGIAYKAIPFQVDFGQPFINLEEAFSYYRHYYGAHLTERELREMADRQLQPAPCGLYLPKNKKLGVIIANL